MKTGSKMYLLILRWGRALQQSLRWLALHRMRTLLSTLGVFFGVAALVAILAIGEGATQATLAQIERLGMNSIIIRQPSLVECSEADPGRAIGLSWSDAVALSHHIPALTAVAPIKPLEIQLQGVSPSLMPEIIATTSDLQAIKKFELAEGRFLCPLDRREGRRVCVLGHEVAQSLGSMGHVGQTLRLDRATYEVVGVLHPLERTESRHQPLTERNFNQVILVALPPFMDFEPVHSPHSAVAEIILEVQLAAQVHPLSKWAAHLLHRLHQGRADYQIVIPQALFQQAQRTRRLFSWVVGGIAALSLLAGGVGIMNVMLASVFERTKEIGMRRALGASQKDILVQFLLETLLLTLCGSVLGIFAGIAGALTVGAMAQLHVAITAGSLGLALSMAAVVGVCAGLYPARQAAKMHPIQALRHD